MSGGDFAISCIPGIIAGIISGLFGGGVIGPSLHHWFTCRREKASVIADRKRAFVGFLKGWRYEIGQTRLAAGGGGFEGRHETFGPVISTFIQEANLIEPDFPEKNRGKFKTLCAAITSIEHPTVYGPDDRKKAQGSIDAIIAFVEENSRK